MLFTVPWRRINYLGKYLTKQVQTYPENCKYLLKEIRGPSK